MTRQNPLRYVIAIVIALVGVLVVYAALTTPGLSLLVWAGAAIVLVGVIVAASLQIADQWEKAVVLHLGRFSGLRGPGIFVIVPFIDTVAYWIDLRTITTSFRAEKTLTRDTVPVDVEAVLFWRVRDPEKAALEVEDYRSAISWAAQTALREVIGKSNLADMLEGREKLDAELQRIIDVRTEQWGIHVSSVEIRDILIPRELQDAMSMQAQAERERQARVILGDSELQVAKKFEEAARTYQDNPTALHLRAMNMLYEGLKEKATLVLVPASVLDTMNLGTTLGLSALAKNTMEDNGDRRGSTAGEAKSRKPPATEPGAP
ncbi:slipin family protein [Methanoculleus sp.]|uniref:slipin family protein n=1 Tax=Methanoculleus sp. TaxID=90427 RepID=UPI0025FC2201|nr:slipin family protein [Methanoculleus sp.]MCK9317908.1 slipin family protein [Methanoculleus sp.]MDD2253698.1 slipin family protein [Methanoculleus sp.]MDD2788025.1 slipin family protein [Methanoculleus sp.]MDD3217057.1 slipin family protein [Methanoculleus sp.]MDD4314501.1 slipin family protein [Methanoculleus sp.]